VSGPSEPSGRSGRFERAIAAIDAANAGDPHRIEVRGEVRPKELAHAELMTEWVRRLDPAATEAQLLAARAHHLRRWTTPRASYPEGRSGYLRWRADLKAQHAREVGEILIAAGYDGETVATVERIVRKEGLHSDRRVQVHEDALCLVFLETQLASTAERLGEDRMVEVIRKTVAKMSERGLAHVAEIPMRDPDRELVSRALRTG
jgi:hypothetical protein